LAKNEPVENAAALGFEVVAGDPTNQGKSILFSHKYAQYALQNFVIQNGLELFTANAALARLRILQDGYGQLPQPG
jgi:hypothetical protein